MAKEQKSYLTISELVKKFRKYYPELTASKLRFLETKGLLAPKRAENKYRIYFNNDIKKISIQSILDKSMNLVHAQLVKSYIEKADIVIEPKIGDFGFFDFVKGQQIIEAGRKAAIKKIPEIKKKLKIR